jgi:hypothetical protein
MHNSTRAGLAARILLTIGALLPYSRLLTLRVLYITDDYFASDIFNGELPGRVLIGRMIRHGQMPVWTNQLCSGLPLAGSPADPIGLAVFSLLPTAAALDLYVIVLLLIAAHGAYGLARRFGADLPGAVLAGLAFAGSGYIACQLKHLAILSTVVWLPVGLTLLDRALEIAQLAPGSSPPRGDGARRATYIAAFGLTFAMQVLAGFPQSAYICALVYGAFVLFRAIGERRRVGFSRARLTVLAGIGAATLLGGAAGGIVLLPLSALSSVSDRAEALGWTWSTRLAYWPPNFLTFLRPYIYGDISNNTYVGPPFFWEDYGYVGLATFLLAIYGGIREWKRPAVLFTVATTVVAYLFVLGQATPVFRVAYLLIPGISMFRFPTRFLIVVEMGLALLAAFGLTRLRAEIERQWQPPSRVPVLIAMGLCAITSVDLIVHQPRQNPMVPAAQWLAPPATVNDVHQGTAAPRTYTPRHRDMHRRTFQLAHGWADVEPYFEIRDLLAPNTGGGLWDTPSADCYAGISARWFVDVWGDHNRENAFLSPLSYLDFNQQRLHVHSAFVNILRTYGVTHVLSPFPEADGRIPLAAEEAHAFVYRIPGAARVRFVRGATVVATDRDAAKRMLDPSFDPDREILLEDASDTLSSHEGITTGAALPAAASPSITYEDPRHLLIDASAPADGFLLLADTFYPGWTATVDNATTPIYRANVSTRGIALPKGRHQVRFTYDAPGFALGSTLTAAAGATLLLWLGIAAARSRRSSR